MVLLPETENNDPNQICPEGFFRIGVPGEPLLFVCATLGPGQEAP